MKKLFFIIAILCLVGVATANPLDDIYAIIFPTPTPAQMPNVQEQMVISTTLGLLVIPTPTPVPSFDNTSGYITQSDWETLILPKTEDGQPVQFYSRAYNASEWDWDFGDGQTSTHENPYTIYKNTGGFNVTLTASNPISSKTTIKTNHINVNTGGRV